MLVELLAALGVAHDAMSARTECHCKQFSFGGGGGGGGGERGHCI